MKKLIFIIALFIGVKAFGQAPVSPVVINQAAVYWDTSNSSLWDNFRIGTGSSFWFQQIPPQTSQSGKFLTTDGTNLSWGTVSGGGTTTNPLSFTYGFVSQPFSFNGSSAKTATIDTSGGGLLPKLNLFPLGDTRWLKTGATAGGDLTGTYPNPTVNTINSITSSYYDPTSSIQTQLNAKLSTATAATTYAPIASPTFTGIVTIPNGGIFGTPTSVNIANATGMTSAQVTTALGFTPISGNQTITFTPTGDVTGSASGATSLTPALTLASVNSNIGSFTNANITVNAKGLITAASNGAASATGANPTASAGTTAVNGSASTFMRSDGAPKVDSTAFATKALISTYLPKAAIVAAYSPIAGSSSITTVGTLVAGSIPYSLLTGTPATGVSSVSNSDGTITISPTTGAVVASLALGHANNWSGIQTLATPVINGISTGTGVSATATANTLDLRDANANIFANNAVEGFTTTATSNSTTTLTNASTQFQNFTGISNSQTCVLPLSSTLTLGWTYTVGNKVLSTGTVTVESSGGNTVLVLPPGGSSATFVCISTTLNTASAWEIIDNYTFSQGLTAAGTAVTLGGTLTTNKGIAISGTSAGLSMTTSTNSAFFFGTNSGVDEFQGIASDGTNSAKLLLLPTSSEYSYTNATGKQSLIMNGTTTTFTDAANLKGPVLGGQYNATLTSLSLMPKSATDSLYAAKAQGITTFTTTGASGAASYSAGTLNIPNYTLSGLGGVSTSTTVAGFALSGNVTLATLTPGTSFTNSAGAATYNGSAVSTFDINLAHGNVFTTAQSVNTTNITNTSTDGLIAENTQASTAGATLQYSPRLHFISHVWNTTATAADNVADWITEVRPVSGTTPSSSIFFSARNSVSGTGGFTDRFSINSAGHVTVEGVTSTGAQGTGNFVFDGSPTLTTPALGVASATTINKVTITAPATSATLTIANSGTLEETGAFVLNLTATAASTPTFPTGTGTLAYLGGANTWTGVQTINTLSTLVQKTTLSTQNSGTTLSAAQMQSGVKCTATTAVAYTTPTATATATQVGATAGGFWYDWIVDNSASTSSGAITITLGSGFTSGLTAGLTVAIGKVQQYRIVFTSASAAEISEIL